MGIDVVLYFIKRHGLRFACLMLSVGLAHAGEAGRIVLAVGDVQIAGQRATVGSVVSEGDEIVTAGKAYAYMKTIDNGFLILRPDSRARVIAYRVDQQSPANTRVKLELLNGVARSISGQAITPQTRGNFRFNTPVAAIGVRGTDFTVFTSMDSTRVAVAAGGIVVSGFVNGACSPDGSGPCEGATSRELFAGHADKLLQVNRGQALPQLLQDKNLSPNNSAPPRGDEPVGKTSGVVGTNVLAVNSVDLDAQKSEVQFSSTSTTPVAPPAEPVIPSRQIVWGRWQAILGQPGTVDVNKIMDAQGQLLSIGSYFAILRTSGPEWQTPSQGSMGFALTQSEAYILNDKAGTASLASLENGRLQIDFAKSTFATGFDLLSEKNERFPFQAQGHVTRDGRLLGDSQFARPTNMAVTGAVGPENGGSAAYIFQGRIDNQRLAIGGVAWGKR